MARVKVTEKQFDTVPLRNIRVPKAEFVAVWRAAEQHSAEEAERRRTDWYAVGVLLTCRWLTGAIVPSYDGRRRMPLSPVAYRESITYEELIEAEYLAAQRIEQRDCGIATAQPGWPDAIRATLGSGRPEASPAPRIVMQSAVDGSPYRMVATDLPGAIRCGALLPGDHLPTVRSLSERYGVSEGTGTPGHGVAQSGGRDLGVARGRRAVVAEPKGLLSGDGYRHRFDDEGAQREPVG
ncbi:GntR family transcriptional regulator [Pseudonocardia xinjiangensis]|uniref:GntR family transcriptional regulator n=1 Tax=Pseudonocardia xinjiangensis TaxID=75289 RepID=A0ABX1RCQ7_9PSEU|nr:GntR family transcriptional regulator [Pseudonocardia xinjiangensis]NMH77230.1 GntR family transcriptional regulator [Pseudonocardia xinjiangensis]